MRRAAACLAALAAAGAAAAPRHYVLDPEQTFVWFEVRHFGTSTLRGRFGPVAGDVTLDREARSGDVGLRISTAGVWTGVKPLDARLCEGDLLACGSWPEAYFVARNFRFDGDRLAAVRGEFTLRGTSQPLELKAVSWACRQDAERQAEVCGGDFEATVRRSDFGMTFGLPFVGDAVLLRVAVEGLHR